MNSYFSHLLPALVLTACWLTSTANLNAQQQRHQRPFDAAYPDIHDPVMAQGEDGRYYLFATGGGVTVLSSADMKSWQPEKPVHEGPIAWAKDTVPGFMGCWAPDISRHGDKWYCYYSCSTFGKNGSAIGLATNKTLDPNSPDFKWEDQGPVIVSHRGRDNWNAIDPNLIVTPKGVPYLVYGSFWDGIQLIKLDKDFKTPLTKPRTVARRLKRSVALEDVPFSVENGRDTIEAGENAIEAPFIIRRGKYYYMFVSFDYCCRGKNSTYKVVYGRSKKVEGPYLDEDGVPMEQGGGTLLVGPTDRFYGMGHNSAYDLGNDNWVFVCHAYDSEFGARSKLRIREMTFDKKGWIHIKD